MKDREEHGMAKGLTPSARRGGHLVPAPSRQIVVNGTSHVVETDEIGHDQLVRLAFPELRPENARSLTISYEGGPLQATEGLLTPFQRTPIAEGERFVVALTSAS